jgi:hypothetical protein
LDLARSLVTIHGGILWSEPLPAGGTKVSFTIPEEPPVLEGPELEAASEAMRQLAESAAQAPTAVAVLEPEVEVNLLEEAQAEAARALELEIMTDLATAEAPAGIEDLAPALEPEAEDLIELEMGEEAPVLEPADAEMEPEADVELPEEPEAPVEALHAEAEPVTAPAPTEAVAEPVAEPVMPPQPFIPDPLHPATQLLRGLALDFDPDADGAPRWYQG